MRILKIAALVLAAAAVASCCSCRTKSKTASLTANNWQVIQMDGEAFAPSRAESYTLQFGVDNRVSGMGDCNRLMGGYTSDAEGNLRFEGAAGTRMFCTDQQTEDKFMRLIGEVDGYSIDGNTLMLKSGGQVVMILKKVS
ncbi:MAG: META domain-containing protein [Rikenellaceae bacterium]|nr:META domain-containing protein [Rikenellaceae bacterium]